jgi:hypothetical protein
VPATLVVTDEFTSLARAERRGLGVPALPFTLIEHPLGDQSASGVEARAAVAIDQIVYALTTPEGELTEMEGQRQYPEPKSRQKRRPATAS